MALTPMMRQYMDIKNKYEDCILFYRLGDFYEMFFEDAKTASRELELVLTGRECGLEEKAPMCGIPFHAATNYISRLVNKGFKVAICEQVEDPSQAKGIVKRDVIKVITPGTYSETTGPDRGRRCLCGDDIKIFRDAPCKPFRDPCQAVSGDPGDPASDRHADGTAWLVGGLCDPVRCLI